MGQESSREELLIARLKDSLRTRGTRVKKKDLKRFFVFLEDVCPWLPQEGTISEKKWQRVGDCLQDYYRVFGPVKVPVSEFSYWNLINDILHVHCEWPDLQKVVIEGEKGLKSRSRPPSEASRPASPSFKTHPSDPATNTSQDPNELPPLPTIESLSPSLPQRSRREPITAVNIAVLLGLGAVGASTGISSLVLYRSRYHELSATIDQDIQELQKGISDLTDLISPLAEVVLQNYRGLDLLFLQQFGFRRCCFYADKTGVDRDSMRRVGEGLEKRRIEREQT